MVDLSSVRIEPRVIEFEGRGGTIQKTFTLINDSARAIYRFRAYLASSNSSIEEVDISFPKEYAITANEFDQQKHAVCGIYHIQTNDGDEGKLVNIYKVPAKTELPFYIEARGGVKVKFGPVEWSPEEPGVMIKEAGGTEVPMFLTSNFGNDEGEFKRPGLIKGMKQMLFRFK